MFILESLSPRAGKHFLDLGSGTGRAVVAWSLLVPGRPVHRSGDGRRR